MLPELKKTPGVLTVRDLSCQFFSTSNLRLFSGMDFNELLRMQFAVTVSADEKSFKTSIDGVFAAGDVINKGPDIAVRAIAGGKNAARSIDCYLNGIVLTPELPQYAENKELNYPMLGATENILKDYQTGRSAPWFFILDENRIIRKIVQGYSLERTGEEISHAIHKLMEAQ